MSGERRSKIAGILLMFLVCFILLLASGAGAEEAEGEVENILLDQVNDNQADNCTWAESGVLGARAMAANSIDILKEDTYSDDVDCDGLEILFTYDGIEDCFETYNTTVPVETKFEYTITIKNTGLTCDYTELWDFQEAVTADLETTQQPPGSWNDDVGDTALATHTLILDGKGAEPPAVAGMEWLGDQQNPETLSWGSVEDDSKAILALDSAGYDMWEEIAALMLRQRPDGSFGGIEDTSWAVIALSANYNDETAKSMERAVTWLRNQEYDNNEDLALAALAEQYYEDAQFREELEREGGGGTGYIPPPWMLALSALIMGAVVLPYWLFARIEREEVLDGPRKDIYRYVTEHPGEHMARITKSLGLSSSSVRYHLSVLEDRDYIVTHKNGKYKRYYINKNGYSKYTNGNGYKHIMSALKNNTARNIVKFLLSHPRSNQKRVSRALDIHPSTVTWHAKRLEEAEIISKHRKGKEIHYSLNSDVQLRKVIGIIEGSPVY